MVGFFEQPPKFLGEFQHARVRHDPVSGRAEVTESEPVGYSATPAVIGIGGRKGMLLATDEDHRIAVMEDRRKIIAGGDLAGRLRGSQSSPRLKTP